jgi:hypothetical protein
MHYSLINISFTVSEHAGAPPHPITEPGRFPPGALDVVRQGRNRSPSPDLAPYDDLPEIVVETV